MANNYTEFSVLVPLATEAERAWVKKTLSEPHEDLLPEGRDDGEGDVEFEWDLDDEGLCIYSNGHGNTDAVEIFFKLFLADAPTKLTKLTAEFCYRCDRPKPGEFGGAAVIVWVGDDEEQTIQSDWCSTSAWLNEKLNA